MGVVRRMMKRGRGRGPRRGEGDRLIVGKALWEGGEVLEGGQRERERHKQINKSSG